ncbi:MAG: DedA family protein [Chthoniobacterales bacterium]
MHQRCFGKPILKSRWIARFVDATAIERCQIRFDNHASLALVASRFVPGTRLPTYLAAGLLSMPVTQFAAVTPFGALVWIGGIFIITKLLGSQALIGSRFYRARSQQSSSLHSFSRQRSSSSNDSSRMVGTARRAVRSAHPTVRRARRSRPTTRFQKQGHVRVLKNGARPY